MEVRELNILLIYNIMILSKHYCMAGTHILGRLCSFFLKKPLFSYKLYLIFDFFISFILRFNVKYHKVNYFDKISPNSVFFVLRKK